MLLQKQNNKKNTTSMSITRTNVKVHTVTEFVEQQKPDVMTLLHHKGSRLCL